MRVKRTSPPRRTDMVLALQMMYRSKPCLPFFSSIVKNVASPNIEIKKLVYIYLLQFAESEPDLALLSINTIQKSLTDQNPQVRALALRVMSGIRVPVISQIVSLAIKRGCGDMSPHVRKAAALAIPKCYRLDPKTSSQLLDYLSILLGDRQYFVVGSAVIAFLEVCPDRIDLIHKHYRALVRKLVDMDEWGQLATLKLMTYYSRKCFPRRTRKKKKNKSKSFYDEDENDGDDDDLGQQVQVLDPDLELLLKACKNMLQSRNSAVVVAVARCFLYLDTTEYIDSSVGPLVALLRSPQDVQQIAMYNIVVVCLVRPAPFVRYISHFLVHATDSIAISLLKFEILTLLFPHCESHYKEMIFCELEHFSRASNAELVQESVRAIGRCAQQDTKASARCLRLLFQQTSSQDGNLVAESLTVIRHLIQQNPRVHVQTVIRLAKNLDKISNPQARATIIWLVGEFAGVEDKDNIAPDVLRILAKGFADESEEAKQQIVLLAAKVYLHYLNRPSPLPEEDDLENINPPPTQPPNPLDSNPEEGGSGEPNPFNNSPQAPSSPAPQSESSHPIPLLYRYIMLLTRYDTSYDLRDRARTYLALLSNPNSTQLASLLLLAPKPVPHVPSPSESRRGLILGSSTLVIGADEASVRGYEDLPEWVREGEEPACELRDEPLQVADARADGRNVPAVERLKSVGAAEGSGAEKGKGKGKEKVTGKSFEDWLAEEEKSGDSSTGEEDDDDDDDEEEETDSGEGESGDDDESDSD